MKPFSERNVLLEVLEEEAAALIGRPVHQHDSLVDGWVYYLRWTGLLFLRGSARERCATEAHRLILEVMAKRKPDEFIESYSAVWRCLRATVARSYSTTEVGLKQAKFLRYIGRNAHISQAELARATETDRALTGRALETLVERGWVRRKRSEEDLRQYVLELSASGERAREKVDDARRRIAERIVAELTEKDLDDFERIAKKLLAAFGESVEETAKS